ncbi:MAG: TRAP transporter substrate-binding protein [Ectothiorhodospiraceae bacterium]|nr:TRAP transporter substrate-binding protein [Ectothiorhodospiraceae bacterium]
MKPWAERIEEESDGRIKVDLQPTGVFGQPAQYLELVENGILDAAWFVPGYSPGRFNRSSVMELPFQFTSGEAASQAYWQMYEEGHFGSEYDRVKPIALFMNKPYILFTTDRKIESLSDMRGLNIRAASRLIGQTIEAMGGTAIGMPVNEMAESIRLGVLDGTVFAYEAVKPFGIDGLVKEMNEIPIASLTHILIMSKRKYESMPEDLREIIDRNSGAEFSRALGESYDRADDHYREDFYESSAHNINAPSDQLIADMEEAVKPVVEGWLSERSRDGVDGQAILDRMQELAAELED